MPRPAPSRSSSCTTRAGSPGTSPMPGPTATGSPGPGSSLVFCADGLIAGNVDTYELEGLKTVADAAYIRRLSRNVGRGYEQKWRLFADPGGHRAARLRAGRRAPAAGTGRGTGARPVRRAFALYATGSLERHGARRRARPHRGRARRDPHQPALCRPVIRHKGKPDEEEKPARFAAPGRPRALRPGPGDPGRAPDAATRAVIAEASAPYPLVRLMRCVGCGSGVPRRRQRRPPAHPARQAARLRPIGDVPSRAVRGPDRAPLRPRTAVRGRRRAGAPGDARRDRRAGGA